MKLSDIDLNLLVILDALLSEQHVTRAAERLYVSWCRERSASNRGKKSSVSSSKAAKRSRFYDDIEAYGRELASRRTS